MSIPLTCKSCGALIGEANGFAFGMLEPAIGFDCPGKGNHQEPVETHTSRAFGLVRQTTTRYPETRTTSSWGEYVGPKKRFFVWLAIIMMGSGILINHKWIWWELGTGFFGEGLKELA